MTLSYLQIFADKVELLEPFDDAERGRLLTAMLAYAMQDEEPVLTGNERYIWPVFRQMIDQSKAALQSKQAGGRARQASNGQQTAAEASRPQQDAAAPQQDPAEASNGQQTAAEDPIIQESRIKNQESRTKNQREEGKRTRFSPPTVDEVAAYARTADLQLDAQRFCDFYASKGWKVGGSPMKDWQAAARNWAARDQLPSPRGAPAVKTVEQQQYSQRVYVHSEAGLDAMMAEHLKEAAS